MSSIVTEIKDGQLLVRTPFPHQNFNTAAKNAGGTWSPAKAAWIFDPRNATLVRAALVKHYGGDGTAPPDVVSIVIDLEPRTAWQGPVVVIGRVIARAYGRDSGARLGPGVVSILGDHTSGGSHKNWENYTSGEYLLHDVPRALATRLIEGRHKYGGLTVKLYAPSLADDGDDSDTVEQPAASEGGSPATPEVEMPATPEVTASSVGRRKIARAPHRRGRAPPSDLRRDYRDHR